MLVANNQHFWGQDGQQRAPVPARRLGSAFSSAVSEPRSEALSSSPSRSEFNSLKMTLSQVMQQLHTLDRERLQSVRDMETAMGGLALSREQRRAARAAAAAAAAASGAGGRPFASWSVAAGGGSAIEGAGARRAVASYSAAAS